MKVLSVAGSVEAWLVRVRDVDPDVADSPVAATALAMAQRIDSGAGSPSECGKVVLMALEQLRGMMPAEQEADDVDDIGDELAARRQRVAAASDLSRS